MPLKGIQETVQRYALHHLFYCLSQYVSPLVYIRRFPCLVIDNSVLSLYLMRLSFTSLKFIYWLRYLCINYTPSVLI